MDYPMETSQKELEQEPPKHQYEKKRSLNEFSPLTDDKSIRTEKVELKTVQDSKTCPHVFIMRGTHQMECTTGCGMGLYVTSVQEFEMLQKRLTKNQPMLK